VTLASWALELEVVVCVLEVDVVLRVVVEVVRREDVKRDEVEVEEEEVEETLWVPKPW
jgi:hypothetical protein